MLSEPNLTDQDYESLSAYIDEMLEDSERLALEARLQAEPLLRRELAALRQTVALIHQLPTLKAPRNFTLPIVPVESEAKSSSSPPLRVIEPEKLRRIIPFPLISTLSAAVAAILIFVGVGLIFSSSNNRQLTTSSDAASPNDVAVLLSPTSPFTDDSPVTPAPSGTLPALFANTNELSTAERLTLSAPIQATALYAVSTQTAGDAAREAEIKLTATQLHNLFLTPTLTYATSAAPAAPNQPLPSSAPAGSGGAGGTVPNTADSFNELMPSVPIEGVAGMAQIQATSTPPQTSVPTQQMEAASGLSANEASAAESSVSTSAPPIAPAPTLLMEARAVETDVSIETGSIVETDVSVEITATATIAGSAGADASSAESQIAQTLAESTESGLIEAQESSAQEEQTAPPLTPKNENETSDNALLGIVLVILGSIVAVAAVLFYLRN